MPMSSAEIAQANGAFQGLAANNLAYANLIGQGPLASASNYASRGDAWTGGALNRASAIGGPLAAGALGLMGLDPMSLGLRAGWSAFSSGAGLGGAALAGGAVALPAAAALASVQYAGSQMMTGAQQQLGLNDALRSSFSFRNSSGGQGFSRSDMTSVGATLREMTHSFGASGEVTSFRELAQLTGQMGQMGLTQGVRDVQEFSRKFKETVTALKTMATTLGTTLEGALEFANSAKQSGVFGMGRASQFTSLIRGTSVAGGLAVSEVTNAAGVGSQISRAVGGLGRQGAVAGIRTIGQIGIAREMGVLSEEDIYNVTGLTGAEGRQSYAASSLQRTAGFLRSGRGRRLLASVAGKDGTLNEAAVSELLTGGMSISETMRLDQENLSKIGRANFIRNEGRLRGAALERLGGFVPALQMMEWARSKGVDIGDMNDRTMLFAQRQLGMGRDEADQAVKMAQNMPTLLEQERRSGAYDRYAQGLAQRRRQQGLEGAGQRFEQAKEIINGKLQKFGQDVFNAGSETVDRFLNELLSSYVTTYSKDIDDAYRSMRSGGVLGREAAARSFGLGSRMSAHAGRLGAGFGGVRGTAPDELARDLFRGSHGDMGASMASDLTLGRVALLGVGGALLGGQSGRYILQGQSAAGRLREAGYDFSGLKTPDIEAKLRDIESTRLAVATGFNKDQVGVGADNAGWIRKAYAMGGVSGEGDLRMESFRRLLKREADAGNNGAWRLYTQWNQAKSQAERAQLMANTERGAQIHDQASLANHYGLPQGLGLGLERGGFASVGAENEAYARAAGFDPRSRTERAVATGLGTALGLAPLGLTMFNPMAAVAGAALLHRPAMRFAEDLVGRFTGSAEKTQAVGAFYKGSRFRDLAYGALSANGADRASTQREIEDEILRRKDDDPVRGELQRLLKYKSYSDRLIASGGNLSKDDEDAIAKETGMSVAELKRGVGSMFGAATKLQDRDRKEQERRIREYAGGERTRLAMLGVFDSARGALTTDGEGKIGKMSAAAQHYIRSSVELTNREYAGGGLDEEAASLSDARGRDLERLSVKERRKIAAMFAGTDIGAEAGRSAAMGERFHSLAKRRGNVGAAADILGIRLSKDDLKSLDLRGQGAAQLLARGGISDESLVHEIQSGARSGSLSESLRRVVESAPFQKAQKERQMHDAESNDPLGAALKDIASRSYDVLEKIAKKLDVSNEALSKLDPKSPENKP